jgi:hypothetical protein
MRRVLPLKKASGMEDRAKLTRVPLPSFIYIYQDKVQASTG